MTNIQTRPFGSGGIEVSELGFGTSQIGNTDHSLSGVNHRSLKIATKVLDTAIENGITFFDTGENYGSSEFQMGKLLKRYSAQKLVIATKAGLRKNQSRNFTSKNLMSSVKASINRMNVDKLDIFQVNKPSVDDWQNSELTDTLMELKYRNKINLAGAIIGDIESGYKAIESKAIDCIQILYNLIYQETDELITLAHKAGLGIIVRSPLNSGLLSGSYTPNTKFKRTDARSKFFIGRIFQERLTALKHIQRELEIKDANLLSYAISFILSRPEISTVIPAASRPEQVVAYALAAKRKIKLSPSERAYIRQIVEKYIHLSSDKIQQT